MMEYAQGALTLLDLPRVWLDYLNADGLTRLLATCKALRDCVLETRKFTYHLIAAAEQDGGALARSALHLACSKSPGLALCLQGPHCGDRQEPKPMPLSPACDANARLDSFLRQTVPFGAPISSLTLKTMTLDILIPPWLAHLSTRTPALQTLHIPGDCTFKLASPPLPSPPLTPTCLNIRRLELHLSSAAVGSSASALQLWHDQLRCLPNLESVTLHSTDVSDACLSDCCSAIGHQLTHLCLSGAIHTTRTLLPDCFGTWFPRITHLQLPHKEISDQDINLLITMLPQLLRFECDVIGLHRNHTNHTCPWVHLTQRVLCVASMSRLHMPYLRTLEFPPHAHWCVTRDPADAAPSLALLNKCRIQWPHNGSVLISGYGFTAPAASVAAVLPLLSHCTKAMSLEIWVSLVTKDLLDVMKQHLAGMPVPKVILSCFGFAPGLAAELLPSLPPSVRVLELKGPMLPSKTPCMTEAQLKDMCAHAQRAIQVCTWQQVRGAWPAGWQLRVQDTKTDRDRAHKYVTFVDVVD